jgi:hypothetical protein
VTDPDLVCLESPSNGRAIPPLLKADTRPSEEKAMPEDTRQSEQLSATVDATTDELLKLDHHLRDLLTEVKRRADAGGTMAAAALEEVLLVAVQHVDAAVDGLTEVAAGIEADEIEAMLEAAGEMIQAANDADAPGAMP